MATKLAGVSRNKPSRAHMPVQAQALLQQAFALHQAGRLAEAQAIYKDVIKLEPRNFNAMHLSGVIAIQTGQWELALDLIEKAIKIEPGVAAAYNNRGKALKELGRLGEALTSYEKALVLKPDYLEAYNNRGNVLLKLHRPEEALSSFDKALLLKADDAEIHNGRGNVLQVLRRLDEALVSFEKALALQPNHAGTYLNLGNLFKALCFSEKAVACYDKALALRPGSSDAYFARGNALTDLNRLEEAVASYHAALKLNPDQEFLLGSYLHAKMRICDWNSLVDELQKYEASISAGRKITVPFPLLALLDDPVLQKTAAEVFTETRFPKRQALGPFSRRAPGGKIRVGYYSADFHDHATIYLMAQFLEEHDAEKFEVYCFSFGPDRDDGMRRRVCSAVKGFFDVRNKTGVEVVELSKKLEIDIAVDLKGYTHTARPEIFAIGCAPVQVNYLGYPGTMGAEYIDYVIADSIVIPEESQSCFTEKVVYLPGCYQANDSTRAISARVLTREEFGLPQEGVVFCSFNNNYKILPSTFDSWSRILKAVEGSVLWLFQDNPTAAKNLCREAEARGIASNRLVFAKRVPSDEHLARHRLADLFLDTLPCNAHTTASDALWAGLPLLTCMGRSFAGRVAASLLNALDLPELVTRTQEDYEHKAIQLACHPAELARVKDKLDRNRITAPLFNGKLFAREIEAAFQIMYDRHHAGLPAAPIDLRNRPSCVDEPMAASGR